MATIQFELERMYDLVKESQDERDKIQEELRQVRMELEETRHHNAELREFLRRVEHDNFVSKQILDSMTVLNKTTYEYLKEIRNDKKRLEKQVNVLTDGTIKYKLKVDPDDLEEYEHIGKKYLRDLLTDAIYNKYGRLIGYINEDNELVQIQRS